MKPDIIEESKMTYDDRYKLLRLAKKNNIVLALRRSTQGRWFLVAVTTPQYASSAFLTQYFANCYFNKLVEKYGLKEVNKNGNDM